jgi:pimeloyl-ACP methyl ester carboxylesterase
MTDSAPADRRLMFEVQHAQLQGGHRIAYVRSGIGGSPLLLLHGYPETKRIWWRNIPELAAAGFDVIAPDLRGFGDSDPAPDGHYDPAAFASDAHELLTDVLGLDQCVAAGGDVGGSVLYDLGLRFPGFVTRQCFFNAAPPLLDDAYHDAGIPPDPPRETRPAADYFLRQGNHADALLAELDTPERRRAYVAGFYSHRLWAAPGSFTADDIDFMTEPFADDASLRASWGVYEFACGKRAPSMMPRLFETNPIPTLILYGPEDHVVLPSFTARCEVAFESCVGPFVVPGGGHFLQWERPTVFNRALEHFLSPGQHPPSSLDTRGPTP